MYQDKAENSIDLIEDCLDQIYRVRRRSLQVRINLSKADLEKSVADAQKALSPAKSANILDVDNSDEENEALAVELSQRLKTPSSIPPNTFSAKPALVKVPSFSKKKKEEKLPSPAEFYDDFIRDYNIFIKRAQTAEEPLDEDEMEDECELLTEKFFTRGLDLLPGSAEVTNIKKKISAHLEELASGVFKKIPEVNKPVQIGSSSSASAEIMDDKTKELPPSPLKKKAVKFHEGESSEQAESVDESSKPRTKAPLDKAAAEKQRIKQQYEAYMKLKRKTEVHPDNSKVKEYEDLSSEIQNLIGTIQGGK